jgi:hypothetical protein
MWLLALITQSQPFEELARDPVLTVACVLLVGVSIAWVIVTRLISRELRRAAARRKPARRRPAPPRDEWR